MPIPTITAGILFEPASPEDGFLPEGLRMLSRNGRPTLGWVNIQTSPEATTGTLWLRDWETGTTESFALPGRPGFFLPTVTPETVLIGLTKQIGLFDLRTGNWQPLADIPDDHPRTIINDAEVTPDGLFVVFGTKDVLFQDRIAKLYLYDVRSQTIHLLDEGHTCSNGKIIHATESGYVLFDIDTPTKMVRKFHLQIDPPKLEYLSTSLDLTNALGFPDGMTDAGSDRVLIAYYNPVPAEHGLAITYDLRTGLPVNEWRMPGSPRVTCPLLTEIQGKSFAVFTTALEGMPKELMASCPHAGALFIAESKNLCAPKSVLVKTNG